MNYVDTFIQIAPDSKALEPVVPRPRGGRRSVACVEFDLISGNPYRFTQEEIQFLVFLEREGISRPKKPSLAIAADAGSSVSVTMDQIAIADLAAFEHLGKQPAPVNERFDNAFAGDFLKPRTGFIQLESTQRCVTHLENLIHEVR